MGSHALLSPSSSDRWMNCAGSIAATIDLTGDSSNEFAREGTAAHVLGERALAYSDQGRRAHFWIGETIDVAYEENGEQKVQQFVVDEDMADFVQVYVDAVLREPGELLVERKLSLAPVYGVEDQFGTSDAVKLDHEHQRLYVGDLKYGRGVMVFAKGNNQLYSYAASALREYDILGDWRTITVAIHQPRLGHYDEHTLTREELEAWIVDAAAKAQRAMSLIPESAQTIEANKTPGEKQCQWCPIRGNCVALASWVHEQVYADFSDLTVEPEIVKETAGIDDATLGALLKRTDLIAGVISDWRAEGLKRVQAGIPVPGWKVIAGRKGARQWEDDSKVEETLKAARVKADDMYTKKLISAPQAEKAFAKKKPKIWTKLAALITQKDGAPSLAEESHPSPALVVAKADQFQDETDFSDLMGGLDV